VRCPSCGVDEDRVVDSRAAEGGAAIRRRRECLRCGERFSTVERAEFQGLSVRKRGGGLEPFARDKLAAGIRKAAANLNLEPEVVEDVIAGIEARLFRLGRREVQSDLVGTEVLESLRALHPVAYLRFASVYKGFTDTEDFRRELANLEPPAGSPAPPV